MKNIIILLSILASTALASAAQTGIRSVDFQNFTYQPDYCSVEDAQNIKVVGGKYQSDAEDDIDAIYFTIYGTEFGDLDGDGDEEAVILSMCNTGGTGNFTEAYIYKMIGGKPTRIMLLTGGDRADGGLRKAWVEDHLLVVESNDPGESGGACCPEFIVTSKYRYSDKRLEEVSSVKREIYPAVRIRFEKGKTAATFKLKITADEEIKRFVVGAGSGQTLTVSQTNSESTISLRQGEAEILDEGERLVARLKATGDYLFEIRNYTDRDLEFIVTVRIE